MAVTSLAFNPDQLRDAHGRWAGEGGGFDSFVVGLSQPDSGFTVQPVSGHQPTHGFAVSVYKGHENVIPASKVTPADLARFVRDNAAMLDQDDNYFGAWHNPEDGNVYLDVSKHVESRAEAERLGQDHNQIAYFDFEAGSSVPVAPKPKSLYRDKLALLLGGEGSGNFGHAGRVGEVGGSAPGPGGGHGGADLEHRPAPVTLYHTSEVTFASGKPAFDAFFGDEDFIKSFPHEFGSKTYAITLRPDVKILDLNKPSPAANQFKAALAHQAWPKDTAFQEELLRGAGSPDDVYEAWTDKDHIVAALKQFPQYHGVKYQGEYLLPKATIARTEAKKLRDDDRMHLGDRLLLGDVEGHPFRGNQWTGDSGGTARDATLSDDIDNASSVADVQRALDTAHAQPLRAGSKDFPGVFVTDSHVIEWDGKDEYPSVSDKADWVSQADVSRYYPDYEDKLNEDFWASGGEVYHATTEENADDIERDGIEARAQTRGLSNRSEGSAVYTTTDLESTAMGSYGSEVFAIDTGAMKRDGYTPYSSQEPDIVEGELRSALASAVGLDNYDYDYEAGMAPDTIAIHGHIPAKYVKRVAGHKLRADRLLLDGTSEGAVKGWETRRGGGGPAPAAVSRALDEARDQLSAANGNFIEQMSYDVKEVPIADLQRRERKKVIRTELVRAYRKNPEAVTPISVQRHAPGAKATILDGHHRLDAAKAAGRKKVWVLEVHDTTSMPDAEMTVPFDAGPHEKHVFHDLRADRVDQIYVAFLTRSSMQLGDVAGHPFRGNQWTEGAFYHGTSNELAEHILAEGLKPLSDMDTSSPQGKGFAATSEKVAISYAAMASDDSVDTITVFVFKPEASRYFKPAGKDIGGTPGTWGHARSTEMSSTETVPPEMIQEVRHYKLSDAIDALGPRGGKQYADWESPLDDLEPVSVKKLSHREKLVFLLGDVEGHPFRGNQWTGGVSVVVNGEPIGLAAEARKAGSFEKFEHDFILDIKHGIYWHVTKDPKFTIDPAKGPTDASSMGGGFTTPGALMVTSHLENWDEFYNTDPDTEEPKVTRPYAVLVDLTEVPRKDYHQISRGFGNEFFIPDSSKAKVLAVVPVKTALAMDAEHQAALPQDDEELRAFYDKAVAGGKKKLSHREELALLLGDAPGHPFRGNQWTAVSDDIPDYPGRDISDHVSHVQDAPVAQIEPSESHLDETTVESMMRAMKRGNALPALVVEFSGDTPDGAGDLVTVVDGHHRLEAAKRLGVKNVPVRVRVASEDWRHVKAAGGMAIRVADPSLISVKKLSADRCAAIVLGDYEGHPFRGNQWTGTNGSPSHPASSIDVETAEEGGVWSTTHFSDDHDRQFTETRHAYFHPESEFDDHNIQGQPGVLIRGEVTLQHPRVLDWRESSELTPQRIALLKSMGYDGVVDTDGQEMVAFSPATAFRETSRTDNVTGKSVGDQKPRVAPVLGVDWENTYHYPDFDKPDDHYYHVTLKPVADQIVNKQVLKPGAGSFMGRAVPGPHSKGRVFLTDKDGVSFWASRVEQHASDKYDNPPRVAVVRVPKSAVKNAQPDTIGTKDSGGHKAFFVEGPIQLHADRLQLGDAPGHPFRGNQYTDGEEDSTWPSSIDRPVDLPGLSPKANEVVRAISDSGIGSDYVHELYGSDPQEAFYKIDRLKDADVEQAKAHIKQVSQEMLRSKHGDELIAYRGYTGTEGKTPTISLTLREHTAKNHADMKARRGGPMRQHNEPYLGRVEQFRVKTSDVLSYSEAIGRGTFAEEEIIVPRSALKDLSHREKLALLLGGEGSGNFGHAGRPGEVGGSSAEGGSDPVHAARETVKAWSRAAHITPEQREAVNTILQGTVAGGPFEAFRPVTGTIVFRAQDDDTLHEGPRSFSTSREYAEGMFGEKVFRLRISATHQALDMAKLGAVVGVDEGEIIVNVDGRVRRQARRVDDDDDDHDLSDRLALGDFEGHPFRGNQWKAGGASEYAAAPRVFNTPDDVVKTSDWGKEQWQWQKNGKPTGELLAGEPIPRDQFPETLYHVTTNAPAVESSGVLLGQRSDAGLGGGQADGVSFTSSKEDARVIQRELVRSIKIARGDDSGIEAIERYAREDEHEAGLPKGTLDDAVEFSKYNWDGNRHSREWTFKDGDYREDIPLPKEELADNIRSGTKDALNAYLQIRDHHDIPLLKNPILFGRQDKLRKIDPASVSTLTVPTKNIPAKALVTTGSDKFLHEVRVYSDVPTEGTSATKLSYRAKLAILLGGAGSGNFGHAGRPGEVGGSGPGGSGTPAFKAWFKDSAVVDEDGDPLIVYHGTTHPLESFKEAGEEGLNPESDWGAGVYFTSDPEDASENYAGEGPDLSSRIEQRSDQLESNEDLSREDAHARARAELAGTSPEIIPAFISMQNPVVVGKPNGTSSAKETHFTMEYTYADPKDPDSDIVGEEGTLPEFLGHLRDEASQYHDGARAVDALAEKLSGEDYVSASRLQKLWKETEDTLDHPETGALMNHEVFRAALQRTGFDGVVDRSVHDKFGKGGEARRGHGGGMEHLNPDTTHFVAFKPTQVKSAIGNKGTFDPKNPKIAMSHREKLAIALGDFEGHPFRGNQHTAGARATAIVDTMAVLKDKYPIVAENYPRDSGTEMGSIEEHTKDVAREWANQLPSDTLAGISDRFGSNVEKLMATAIPLHDIGKPDALEEGDKSRQHEHTVPILQDVLRKEGFKEKDVRLATELINHDMLGRLAHGRSPASDHQAVAEKILAKAAKVGMDPKDFATLQVAFFQADASAYPYITQFMERDGTKWNFDKKLAPLHAALGRPVKKLSFLLGDVEGHPFRGNQWTDGSSAASAPVLQGVDFQANAAAMIASHEADPEDAKAAEAELRELPLVHGTTVEGAIGAITDGLRSHAEMDEHADELRLEANDLREELKDSPLGGLDEDWSGWDAEEISRVTDLNHSDATELAAKIHELTDLERVVDGATFESDKALGLDRFVFMTHGQKHPDYGDVGVVIDNKIMPTVVASPNDIAADGGGGSEPYNPTLVEKYRHELVKGDDYYKVAAAEAAVRPGGVTHRDRGDLFEIKAPTVPKSAVKGFVVYSSIEEAERLADRLRSKGIKNKVLYVDQMAGGKTSDYLNHQLKAMQATGRWDDDEREKFDDATGNSGTTYIFRRA